MSHPTRNRSHVDSQCDTMVTHDVTSLSHWPST